MKAVKNIQFVIHTDKWPNTYLYLPVYVTYIKPEFHVLHLSKKKKIFHEMSKKQNVGNGCSCNWLFSLVPIHTSLAKLSRRDPLLWTSLIEQPKKRNKEKEKKSWKRSFPVIKKKVSRNWQIESGNNCF